MRKGNNVLVLVFVILVLFSKSAISGEMLPVEKEEFRDSFLEKLLGNWKITLKIGAEVSENSMEADWLLNHKFLRLHMKDKAVPGQYEALVFVGFDNNKGKYVAHWLDTFGGTFSAVGYGEKRENQIEFKFEYPDQPFFNTFSYEEKSGRWTFTGEQGQKDGKRKLFAIDTLEKQ